MDITITKGKYILAVSGGVDSMALLDILSKLPAIELIVAHFNHGIREDSDADEKLVTETARKYGVPLERGWGRLGPDASEEQARDARYMFLNAVKAKHGADAIVTAHHQDDLIETAIINLLRGTGPLGLVAMDKNKKVIRPLLNTSKKEIIKYARENKITWREDSTNKDPKHLRNYIRLKLLPKVDSASKKKLLKSINDISYLHDESEKLIRKLSEEVRREKLIDRGKLINLPSEIGAQLVTYWLRQYGVKAFDKKTVSRLYLTIKTAKPGTRHNVAQGVWLQVRAKTAEFSANR
jgi:tRNA(Ile)-lysidine synthase